MPHTGERGVFVTGSGNYCAKILVLCEDKLILLEQFILLWLLCKVARSPLLKEFKKRLGP